jgi:hypothetical protein
MLPSDPNFGRLSRLGRTRTDSDGCPGEDPIPNVINVVWPRTFVEGQLATPAGDITSFKAKVEAMTECTLQLKKSVYQRVKNSRKKKAPAYRAYFSCSVNSCPVETRVICIDQAHNSDPEYRDFYKITVLRDGFHRTTPGKSVAIQCNLLEGPRLMLLLPVTDVTVPVPPPVRSSASVPDDRIQTPPRPRYSSPICPSRPTFNFVALPQLQRPRYSISQVMAVVTRRPRITVNRRPRTITSMDTAVRLHIRTSPPEGPPQAQPSSEVILQHLDVTASGLQLSSASEVMAEVSRSPLPPRASDDDDYMDPVPRSERSPRPSSEEYIVPDPPSDMSWHSSLDSLDSDL